MEWDTELKKIPQIKHEFVVVEDGSTDGTKKLITELEKKYCKLKTYIINFFLC